MSNYEIPDLAALFADNDPSELLVKDSRKESDYYNPIPKFAKNGKNYVSRIKFIPYLQNPKSSIVSKWVVYLQHPNGTQKYVDCPSTVDQPSILNKTYFALKNSENSAEKKLADSFSRRKVYFSLVLILEDENKPELVGKIKIFKYGQKLYNRLEKLMKPKDGSSRVKPHDPFNIFNGRPLDLDVCIKAGFNDYDDSEFSINPEPFMIDGKEIENSPKNYKQVAEWILDNSPDLMQNAYKEWDEETLKFVVDTINETIDNQSIVDRLLRESNISSGSTKRKAKKAEVEEESYEKNLRKSYDEEDEDDETESLMSKRAATLKASAKKSTKVVDEEDEEDEDIKPVKTTRVKSKDTKKLDEDFDDILAGL